MPVSKRLKAIGYVHRVEADIPVTVHKKLKELRFDYRVETIGETIVELAKKVTSLGFGSSLDQKKDETVYISELGSLKVTDLLLKLQGEHQHNDQVMDVLNQISACFNGIKTHSSDNDAFIDCYVDSRTHQLFKRFSVAYKHRGTKAKVIIAMIDYLESNT